MLVSSIDFARESFDDGGVSTEGNLGSESANSAEVLTNMGKINIYPTSLPARRYSFPAKGCLPSTHRRDAVVKEEGRDRATDVLIKVVFLSLSPRSTRSVYRAGKSTRLAECGEIELSGGLAKGKWIVSFNP